PNTAPFGWPGVPINCSYNGSGNGCNASNSPFFAPIVLNRADPTMIAIAPGFDQFNNGNFVYVAQDTTPVSATSVNLQTTSVGQVDNTSEVTKLAYGIPSKNNTGASANPNALLAGVQNGDKGEVWFSSNASPSSLVRLDAYTLKGGLPPTAVACDRTSPSDQR